MAAVENLTGLAERHETVARTAFAVACCAEARDVSHLHEPAGDFVQRAAVVDIELGGFLRFGRVVRIAADACLGGAADLRDAEMEDAFARLLAFARGDDHARVGDGDADAGHDLRELVVVDAVLERGGIDVVSGADARDGDRVRADAEGRFQMFRVHEQGGEFVAIALQAEEDAEADVVDAAFHGAVHRFRVVAVVVLRAARMEDFVAFLMIGLLEEDVRSDARVLQLAVVFDGRGGDVHVDAADGAVLVLDAVDRLDGFENVFDRIFDGMLAAFDGQPLVAHVLQRDDFAADFVLRELFARNVFVLKVIRAVDAAVDAVVGEVQRREEDDAVAVEILLDLLRQRVDLLVLLLDVAVQKNGGFAVAQALAQLRLRDDLVDQFDIVLVLFRIVQRRKHFLMVDEFFRFV